MARNPDIPILETATLPAWMQAARRPFHADMFAMFSSEYGGIVTDPLLMNVPVDDHLVHRGDGVFETLKCVQGRLYCYREHLERLYFSAEKIDLTPPYSPEETSRRIMATIRAGNRRDALIRVIFSRGPGSMGINPYDCPLAYLYVLVHAPAKPFMETHPGGARLVTSGIPVKSGVFANIKTCNYLPNALLKKEAVDNHADFAVNFDENGNLAEGATENIGIVTPDNLLMIPDPARILAGTTMKRVFDLADAGITNGWLAGKRTTSITRSMLLNAAEILIFGTTTNVTSVTNLDGKSVGTGEPGPIFRELNRLIQRDLSSDGPQNIHAFA